MPSKSYLRFRGTLKKGDGTVPTHTGIIRNGLTHLFDRIAFELNGVEIDQTREVGITTTIKNYVSIPKYEEESYKSAGWALNDDYKLTLNTVGGFEVIVPLSMLLGFAEDYKRIIVNAKQELVLLLANSPTNALYKAAADAENIVLDLNTIEWLMPHLIVNTRERVKLLKHVEKGRDFDIAFRSWSLETYPTLPMAQKVVWNVKSSFPSEKPRYVIIGFQIARQITLAKDRSLFDSCNIKDIKLHLNSEVYPYTDLNLNFTTGQILILYEMYKSFQETYYGRESAPLLSPNEFMTKAPLFVFDVSKQNDSINSTVIDSRIEIIANANLAANTQAFALIIHDKLISYNARDKLVIVLT